MILRNRTRIEVGPCWVVTHLPNGAIVHAHPESRTHSAAQALGYGDDLAAVTRDHDPLHSILTDALGMPFSFSLMLAAGYEVDAHVADLEEVAVMAAQRLKRAFELSEDDGA